MGLKLKPDTLRAIADWKEGKPQRSLVLASHQADQDRAHSYLFFLLDLFQLNGVPADHDAFQGACSEYHAAFDGEGLTDAERTAAESLVWKALIVGWKKAIDGHGDAQYIEVQKENVNG